MVSDPESAFKRSLKNLYHIWFLLCFAACLSSLLYLNQVTRHTHLTFSQDTYRLYTRQCQEVTGFSTPQSQAPFYYPLWWQAQKLFDHLHQRPALACQKKSPKNTKFPHVGGTWLSTL